MGYLPCTNCLQEILDPTNPHESSAYVHVFTLNVACAIEHLPSDFASDVQQGYAVYVACPELYERL